MRSDTSIPVTATQIFWAVCSAAGLVSVTWASSNVVGEAQFIAEIRQTWSGLTVAFDLLFLGIPVVAFAVIEARRLGMRWPWVWAVLVLPLPGAFVIPMFFLLRERTLLRRQLSADGDRAACL